MHHSLRKTNEHFFFTMFRFFRIHNALVSCWWKRIFRMFSPLFLRLQEWERLVNLISSGLDIPCDPAPGFYRKRPATSRYELRLFTILLPAFLVEELLRTIVERKC